MEADSVLFFLWGCRYRLNGGFGAGFRLNAFDFLLLSFYFCLSLSHLFSRLLPKTVTISLPTELRL
jgi:hypothetical protein